MRSAHAQLADGSGLVGLHRPGIVNVRVPLSCTAVDAGQKRPQVGECRVKLWGATQYHRRCRLNHGGSISSVMVRVESGSCDGNWRIAEAHEKAEHPPFHARKDRTHVAEFVCYLRCKLERTKNA